MPPRIQRRGKGPRDQSQRAEELVEPPSKLLSSILKTLELTFERDIGMHNGKYVRSLPGKPALIELQGQLEKLRSSLNTIADSDQETINSLRQIRDGQRAVAEKEEDRLAKELAEVPIKEFSATDADLQAGTGAAHIKAVTDSSKKKAKDEHNVESSKDENKGIDSESLIKKRNRSPQSMNGTEQNSEEMPTDDYPGSPSKKMKLDPEGNVDINKMENDPSVKNPKSEFVVSQTLPAAAAALGLFNEEGLERTGEDNLKRKYDVASYPTNDLKDLLPGELPDMDFSHPKPTNQIQYSTFLASVENYFRELNDDDIKFLKCKFIIPANLEMDKTYDPEVTPYVIPKLGPLYSNAWIKEDSSQNIANTSPPPINDPSSILPRKSASDLNDSLLDTEDISCGPLVSRLLSAILKDRGDEVGNNNDLKIRVKEENGQTVVNNTANGEHDQLESNEGTPGEVTAHTPVSEAEEPNKTLGGGTTSTLPNPQVWKISSINLDYPTFEERLKRELKYVGIYVNMPKDESNPNGDDPDWLTGREDDEISAELRELQSSLKQVTMKDQKRKVALIPLVEKRLAWQEYSSILDDLDKQIDQAYIKRIRAPKKRKKHHAATATTVSTGTASQAAQQKAANSSLKALLEKRQRWITKIGPLFDKPEVMKRIPKESVFRDMDQEEEEEETDVFGQSGNGKEDELGDP